MSDETLYALLRLGLSVLAMVMMFILFIQSVPKIREVEADPPKRLRMLTIVFALFVITFLLGATAVYDWDRPPPPDDFLAVIGVIIRAFLAYVTTVLVVTDDQNIKRVRAWHKDHPFRGKGPVQ